MYDDDWEYSLLVFVSAEKGFDEFESSVASILEPVRIADHSFWIGGIECKISEVKEQPRNPGSIPTNPYKFCIEVPTSTYDIWSGIDQEFALSLVSSLRGKFLCKCLVTTDDGLSVMYSASHETVQINPKYPNWGNGRFSHFVTKAIEMSA